MNIFQRLFRKFSHAFRGLGITLKEEGSMATHFVIAAIVLVTCLFIQLTFIEWAVILLTISLVIGMELLNTGLENLVDLFEFKYNGKAGKIKDIGAAATLLTTFAAIAVGLLIIIPNLLEAVK